MTEDVTPDLDPAADASRAVEATLFAAVEPLSVQDIAAYVGEDIDIKGALKALQELYAPRGIQLVERGGKWHFQTAGDLAHILRREREENRKLDVLMEAGWVRPAGRRETPGRPLIFATTPAFLAHFGLASRRDLPGIDDLRAAGLLDPVDLAFESMDFEARAEIDGDSDVPDLESDEDDA
jgi:segregation and condensation protein B